MIKGNSECNFKIQRQRRQNTNTLPQLYVTDFVVKSVTATCEYICVVKQSRDAKTVVITGMYACVYTHIM